MQAVCLMISLCFIGLSATAQSAVIPPDRAPQDIPAVFVEE